MYSELLKIKVKKTDKLDITTILYNYLSERFDDNIYPEAHQHIIDKIELLRNTLISYQSKNVSDINTIKHLIKLNKKYYYYLHNIIDNSNNTDIILNSRWTNGFSGTKTTCKTLKLESVIILYNIACLYNQLGISNDIDFKESFLAFKIAASLFDFVKNYINEKSIDTKSTDLNQNMISLLSKLNHAYAIYVFYRSIEIKNASYVSKARVCYHLKDIYISIHRIRQNKLVSSVLDTEWKLFFNFYMLYSSIMAEFNYIMYLESKNFDMKEEQLHRVQECNEDIVLFKKESISLLDKRLKSRLKTGIKIPKLINIGKNIISASDNMYSGLRKDLINMCEENFVEMINDNIRIYNIHLESEFIIPDVKYKPVIVISEYNLSKMLGECDENEFDNIEVVYEKIQKKNMRESIRNDLDNKLKSIKDIHAAFVDTSHKNSSFQVLNKILGNDTILLDQSIKTESLSKQLDEIMVVHNKYVELIKGYKIDFVDVVTNFSSKKDQYISDIYNIKDKLNSININITKISTNMDKALKINEGIGSELESQLSKLNNLKDSKFKIITDDDIKNLNKFRLEKSKVIQNTNHEVNKIINKLLETDLLFESDDTNESIEGVINELHNSFISIIDNSKDMINKLSSDIMDYFMLHDINYDNVTKVKEFIVKLNQDDLTIKLEKDIDNGFKFYNKVNDYILNIGNYISEVKDKIANIEKLQQNYINHKFNAID